MDTPLVAFRPPEPAASLPWWTPDGVRLPARSRSRSDARHRGGVGRAVDRVAGRGRRAVATSLGRSLLALALLSAVSVVGTVAAPALWDRPVLLVLLSPRLPFLIHASAETPWWSVVPVAVVRLMVADPLHYVLGRDGAPASCRRARSWMRRLPGATAVGTRLRGGSIHRLATRSRRVLTRSVPGLILLRPVGRHFVLAGASRSRPSLVALADLAGTGFYVAAVVFGGQALA